DFFSSDDLPSDFSPVGAGGASFFSAGSVFFSAGSEDFVSAPSFASVFVAGASDFGASDLGTSDLGTSDFGASDFGASLVASFFGFLSSVKFMLVFGKSFLFSS